MSLIPIVKQNYRVTVKVLRHIVGQWSKRNLIPTQRKPRYFKALRPDGFPLTFGYEVESEQGENIGLVGQGSMLIYSVLMTYLQNKSCH